MLAVIHNTPPPLGKPVFALIEGNWVRGYMCEDHGFMIAVCEFVTWKSNWQWFDPTANALDDTQALLKDCLFALNDIPRKKFRRKSPLGFTDTYELAEALEALIK